jgi:hypothetical protein
MDTPSRSVYIRLDGMLSSIASGQVERLDPAEYDRIPLRGPDIGTGEDEDAKVLREAGVRG